MRKANINANKEKHKVDDWNRKYPIGQKVIVELDSGKTVETITTHKATLLGGHTAVAWLKDIIGCYDLDRITAITDKEIEILRKLSE